MKACSNCNLILGDSEIRISSEFFHEVYLCHPCIRKQAIVPAAPVVGLMAVGKALNAWRRGQCPVCNTNILKMKIPTASCPACGGAGTADAVRASYGELTKEGIPQFIEWVKGLLSSIGGEAPAAIEDTSNVDFPELESGTGMVAEDGLSPEVGYYERPPRSVS